MCVQGIHLCQCALHEVDHRQDIGRGESGILHKCDVHLLCRKEDKIQPHKPEQKHSFTNLHPGMPKPGVKCFFYKTSHFKGICKNRNPACSFLRGDKKESESYCTHTLFSTELRDAPAIASLQEEKTCGVALSHTWLWLVTALSVTVVPKQTTLRNLSC